VRELILEPRRLAHDVCDWLEAVATCCLRTPEGCCTPHPTCHHTEVSTRIKHTFIGMTRRSSGFVSKKPHRKSRGGCFTCKRKKVKVMDSLGHIMFHSREEWGPLEYPKPEILHNTTPECPELIQHSAMSANQYAATACYAS